MLCLLHPQLGVKALTYNDLIQAQKEISAHNQQLREQSEQLEKDNSELRSQSLRLVRAGAAAAECACMGWRLECPLGWPRCVLWCRTCFLPSMLLLDSFHLSVLPGSCTMSLWPLLQCLLGGGH